MLVIFLLFFGVLLYPLGLFALPGRNDNCHNGRQLLQYSVFSREESPVPKRAQRVMPRRECGLLCWCLTQYLMPELLTTVICCRGCSGCKKSAGRGPLARRCEALEQREKVRFGGNTQVLKGDVSRLWALQEMTETQWRKRAGMGGSQVPLRVAGGVGG